MRRAWPLLVATLATTSLAFDASADEPPPPEGRTPEPRLDPPEQAYRYADPHPFVTPTWLALQLLPSPELAVGKDDAGNTETAFGIRWQLTPVLWSWGVNRRVSRWRLLVVDPLARVSGSLAFETHLEYIGGHVDKVLVRPAVTGTFPLIERGEYLALSLGTSVYAYESEARLAHQVGLYTLSGTLGLVATIAPNHDALTTIATLRIRYF